MSAPSPTGSRRRLAIVAVIAVAVVGGAVALGAAFLPQAETARSSVADAPARSTPTPSPSPAPTETGPAENTEEYDLASLPVVDVFSVTPELPLDDDPFGSTEGIAAQPLASGAPVFADPEAEPVAYLPHTQQFDGTVVPVIDKQEHWVEVLLVGRQGVPPEGDSAQTVGWMRVADVELTRIDSRVEVDLSDRTVDIVTGNETERVAEDFASGTEATPTPLGRSFIMMTRTTSFAYTRGHPMVYLSSQSPTLAGFGGAESAVTAFHYHDARSGTISNGCLRVDPAAIEKLAELPPGTPVYISE